MCVKPSFKGNTMKQSSMSLSRLAIGMCGVVVGAYCAYTAFRNGQGLAPGPDGIAFGAAFGAVVVGSWFLLPRASQEAGIRALLMKAGWLLCVVFVLVNAIGFTATHRSEKVGGNSVAITGYDQALASLTTARAELDTMKANPRWAATQGCTNATADKSIGFCSQVTARQSEISSAGLVLSKGRPASADAQADTIAWVLQADTVTVSRAMPIFMAVVLDIAASLFMFAALAPAVARMPIDITPIVEPVPVTVSKSLRVRAPKKQEAKPLQLLSPPPMKIDMRTKEGREIKRMKAAVAND